MTNIIIAKPPIFDSLVATFGVIPKTAVFTYGDKIYNPENLFIREDVIEHEKVHMKQQGDNPDLWWGRFLREPAFRIDQEARAYGRQYQFICKQHKDRNEQTRFLFFLANILSGPLYGRAVGHAEARTLILKYSK